MTTKNVGFGESETDIGDFADPTTISEIVERAARLRQAVAASGGNKAVSARSGVPLGTLNNYLGGRDMKASPLVALAEATNVRLEWLATGRGPMRPGAESAAPPPPPVGFTPMSVDRLAAALERAGPLLELHRGKLPDPRRFAQILLLMYDEIRASAERPASSHDD